MKKKTFGVRKTLMIGLLLAILPACDTFFEKPAAIHTPADGMVPLRIGVGEKPERSIFPWLPATTDEIDGYDLYGSTSSGPDGGEVYLGKVENLAQDTVMIRPATWNFTLKAYTNGQYILSGSRKNVVITSGYSQPLQFTLKMINQFTGTAFIYIALPGEHAVASVVTTIDGEVLNPPLEVQLSDSQGDAIVFEIFPDDEMAAGDYFVTFTLKDSGGKTLAVIAEILKIRGGADSVQYIDLEPEDFNGPPAAPSSFRATSWAANTLAFAWEDQSNNESGFVLNDGTTDYNIAAGTSGYSIAAASPAGTTYSLKAVNEFGESSAVRFIAAPPDTPEGLTAAAASTSVTLSWQAADRAVSYNILRASSGGGPYTQAGTSATAAYTDVGLASGTDYYYKLIACGIFGNSAETAFYKAGTLLSAPTGVTAAVASLTSVTVSWNTVSGAAGYQVLQATTSDGPYTEIANTTAVSSIVTGLTTGTMYYFRVAAYRNGGEGEISAYVSAKPDRPDTPTGVKAMVESASSITITWNAVSGAAGYYIYRSTTSGGTYTQVGSPVTGTTFTNTGLGSGATWYYKVAAHNTIGTSEQSAYVYATIAVPATPTGLTAAATANGISLSWNTVAGAIEYRVYRSTTSGGTYSQIGTADTNAYADTGLATGLYFYKIAAYNGAGSSAQTAYVSTFTGPAPANVTATAQSSNSITISWASVSGASYYWVYRSTTGVGTFESVGSDISGTSYTNTGLSGGTTYYYIVRAYFYYSGNYYYRDSSNVNATTLLPPPTGLSASAASASSINLSWTAVSDAASYRVYRASSSSGTYTQVGAPTAASFTDTGLTQSATYYYKVSAVHSSGEGTQSAYIAAIILPAPTGVTATASTTSISITVSWNSVSGASAYRVYRSLNADGPYSMVSGNNYSSYTDYSLNQGTTYYYKIAAYTSAVEGLLSAPVSAKTYVPLSPPNNITANATSSSVTLSWNVVSGATRYLIFRWNSIGFEEFIGDTAGTSFTHTGPQRNSWHTYFIASYNADGQSDFSSPVQVYVP